MGADITYRCLGGNTYEITLSFYRDCYGVKAPDSAIYKLASQSCGIQANYVAQPVPGTGKEITHLCSNFLTTCQGGSYTGIQEWIYKDTVTLPMACTDWVVSFNLCCRNSAITNISNPGNTRFYVSSTINNSTVQSNSSPVFSNKPVPFLCVGQQFCFNHGAFDPDGDSLVYSLITPFRDSGLTISYLPPFNANQPLTSSPAVSFNTSNGDICMTPTNLEVTVLAVLVKEYRNGILIGTVERDIQVTVQVCTNALPSLTGINGSPVFSDTICAGESYCFTINSSDADNNQHTFLTWDSTIATASFDIKQKHRSSADFCWTPTTNDISNIPHCFTVTVFDNNCPYYGSQTYSYCLTVKGVKVDAGSDTTLSCYSNVELNAVGSGGSGTYTYLWSTGQAGSSITASPGSYAVTVNDGLCENSDTVNVFAAAGVPIASFSYSNTCTHTSVSFYDHSTVFLDSVISHNWNFGDGNTSTEKNPTHLYLAPGSYQVQLVVQTSCLCTDTIVMNVITGGGKPIPSFISAPVCLNSVSNFTDQSLPVSGTLNSWNWNFGDGNTSSQPNPSHVYSTSGNFSVKLIVINTSGCSDTITLPYTVNPNPVANAGNDIFICEDESVTLMASGGTTFSWSPGPAFDSVYSVTPLQNTVYTVSVSNSFGCIDTAQVMVTVNANPVSSFNASPVCVGSSSIFVNQSLAGAGSISQFKWNFGNSTTSSFQDPVITYSSSGNYQVSLITTNTFGCSDTLLVPYNVNANPIAAFQVPVVCQGVTSVFLNQSMAGGGSISSWTWSFGDGNNSFSQTPSHVYATSGTYPVSLIVQNTLGCKDTLISNYTVNPNPIAYAGLDDSICENSSITLTATGGLSYSWNPGAVASAAIQVSPSVTTNYTVTATNSFGCQSTDMVRVVVNSNPTAAFTSPNVCEGFSTSFTNQSLPGVGSVISYLWNFGDGTNSNVTSPNHLYSDSGTYLVSLLVQNSFGCVDTLSYSYVVNPNPNADAGADVAICENSSTILVASGGNSFNWVPGSVNNDSNIVSPLSNATYSVTVTNGYGCQATDTVQVQVNPNPLAAYTASNVCSGFPSAFNDLSITDSGNITSWNWKFGDGNSSHLQNPIANYLSPGNYTVSLTVQNSYLCYDSIENNYMVYEKPFANAGNDTSICQNASVMLSASGIGNYFWLPGSIGSQSFQVTPANTTTYQVLVTNNFGCQDSDQVTVTVNPNPVALYSGNLTVCEKENISFANQSSISQGKISNFLWDFGNGFQSNLSSPVFSFFTSGNFPVNLTAISDSGCVANFSDTVRVKQNPVALFTAPNVCDYQEVLFSNNSNSVGGGGINYFWDFGNGNSSLAKDPLVSYAQAGTYLVTLVVSESGCSDSAEQNIIVYPSPKTAFGHSNTCEQVPLQFNNTSSISSGTISKWNWDFGDQTTSALKAPSHRYSGSGSYMVELISESDKGCIDTATSPLTVNEKPIVMFTANDVCLNEGVQFTDQSFVNPGKIVNWKWNFGDGTFGFVQNPYKLYRSPGKFQVSLEVTTDSGCVSDPSPANVVEIYDLPHPVFSASTSVVEELFSIVEFTNMTEGSNSYFWDFNDGTYSSMYSLSHSFSSVGIYNVMLVATNSYGCRDTAFRQVEVIPSTSLFIPNTFTPNNDGENDIFRPVFHNFKYIHTDIFDRWGALIYTWTGLEGGWDGYTREKPAQLDVYVYKMIAIDINGVRKAYVGQINLIR